jgi:predicted phage terminase large subunit-like protein
VIDEDARQHLKAARRLLAAHDARESLLEYIKLTMPDAEDPEDAQKSRYVVTPQARLLCEIMEKVDRGELKRVAVAIGPQMGKSEIISRAAPPWMSGRDPYCDMILGSYNQKFADEFGFEVRTRIDSPAHRQIFPEHELVKGGQAKELLVTKQGAKLAFVGVGGSGTGKPAKRFIVDDPIRGPEDARSAAFREGLWNWFNGVVFSRTTDDTAIVIVHTRWHEDDLIGRLCDPEHPERNGLYKGLERRWTYINLPAVVTDPALAKALGLTLAVPTDPDVVAQFGSKPMSALWPGRKSLPLMAEAKQSDSRTFNALYMGRPSPDEGDYFEVGDLVEYDRKDLPAPKQLRMYGASDHAVSTKKNRDFSVIGCVGVDENEDIWVLPNLVWERMKTDRTVEEMLVQMEMHHPQLWWMESELISKSFGPFLFKRMREKEIYIPIDEVTPSADKPTRARAIQGRIQMQKVRFPRFAPWWQNAKAQMLRFPHGTHDDFVDWLAHIGMGLSKQVGMSKIAKKDERDYPTGSIQWIMRKALARARTDGARKAAAGW